MEKDDNDVLKCDLHSSEQLLNESMAENEWLREIINDDSSVVNCYDESKKKYTHELRQCIYGLLENHVSSRHVGGVIEAVLALVNRKPNRLPARSTILDMNIERLILSQKQIADEVVEKENTALYTDETSKFGTKFSGYHISDSEGRMFVLGLRQLQTKSSSDTLNTFQEILNDIQERSEVNDNKISKKLLVNIVATMSDRASTELKFNELLQDLRTEILPELRDNWTYLSSEDQLAASELLNFFCGLHSLVHFAETASCVLIEVEKGFFGDNRPIYDRGFLKAKESGTLRLVRTASKAMARGADEKSGKYHDFKLFAQEFLKTSGFHSLPLEPFRGNRFNVLFENSASVFFLHEKMREFLDANHTNKLLSSVLHDLNVTEFVAGSKALGLVSRLLTGPLWSLIEDRNIHILDMNKNYSKFIHCLDEASHNVADFMTGNCLPFAGDTVVKKDAILDTLLKGWQHDDKVQIYLEVMLPAMAELARRIFKDHLTGGRFEHFTDEMRRKTVGVHKHNKYAESIFVFLDQLLRVNPNISVLSSEAYIMFTSNRTMTWLNTKSAQEKQHLIDSARKDVEPVRQDFQRRKCEIETKQKQSLAENFAKARALEAKRVTKLENYTSDMIYYGLWQSDNQVESALSEILTVTEKRKALKAQLNFRRYVLNQKPEQENLYSFSIRENGKSRQFTVDELTGHLKQLVTQAFTLPTDEAEDGIPILTGKLVQHRFEVEENGKNVKKWWRGKVISQVRGFQEWFNIVYTDQPSVVYTFKLLSDWKNGDLQLIV